MCVACAVRARRAFTFVTDICSGIANAIQKLLSKVSLLQTTNSCINGLRQLASYVHNVIDFSSVSTSLMGK